MDTRAEVALGTMGVHLSQLRLGQIILLLVGLLISGRLM